MQRSSTRLMTTGFSMTDRWGDWTAGLCVAGLLIPEAVAYADLAQLPVAHAMVASLVGLALYAVFGGSRFAIVSPTSSTATLAAAAVLSVPGTVGPGAAAQYAQAYFALVLAAGGILMLLAWGRQGMLSAFVSRPVLRGFAFALAVTILIKQLPDALGLHVPPEVGPGPIQVLAFVLTHLQAVHGWTAAVALSAGALVAVLRRWPVVPASMVVIVLATLAARWFDLAAWGVHAVGPIQQPRAHLALPELPQEEWLRVGELAVGLVVLVFAESWGSMRNLALAHGDTLEPNRELMVLGACNVASALCQGMAVGAGFSASSANAAAGAQSRKSGLIALGVMVLALVYALPMLQWLPRPVLAVAVIAALWHALSPRPIVALWRMNRDRELVLAAVVGVLMLGVLHGMLAAIALSLASALKRFGNPVVHELGELGHSRNYVALDDHPDAMLLPQVLILRPEEPLFFASAERVTAEVLNQIQRRAGTRCLILSLEESSDLDSTAVECLFELDHRLAESGLRFVLARVKEPVRQLLTQLAPQGLGQPGRLYWSVADAVAGVTTTAP